MQCPMCETSALQLAERQGVEIDYCPKCRGIWLDRGELDKIIERAGLEHASRTQAQHHSHDKHSHKPHYKKKSSFLSDLFDF